MTSSRTLYGMCIDDHDYRIRKESDGKIVWTCPFYQRWYNMITRCYSKRQKKYTPSYEGCRVVDSWLRFSNFKSWMKNQDWEGRELDKDLLGDGKTYGPDYCMFLDKKVNLRLRVFLSPMMGVSWHKQRSKWRAYYSDPVTKRQVHLGLHECFGKAKVVANEYRNKEKQDLLSGGFIPTEIAEILLEKGY